jgi:hypothetical protein
MPQPTSSLQAIQIKVRRLTRSPSQAQLSDTDLQNYINTFVVYDFPEHLRMFNLNTVFRFWCNPFQDTYITDATLPTTNPLYNFQNQYISISPPVYVAGFQTFYTQSREEMFGIYPNINSIQSIGFIGDGATQQFTGFITTNSGPNNFLNPTLANQTTTLLQNQVLFDSIDANGNGLSMVDVPIVNTATGNPTVNGNLYVPGTQPATPPVAIDPNNTINYVTGAFTVTFASPPGIGQTINSQTVPTVVSRPLALLFFNEKLILRPVPDQPYEISFEAFIRPTALLAGNQSPQLEEWWQYISYGAAKKIFEDRMDLESVAQIMPEFKQQERLCLRRTIVQNTTQRTPSIYTEYFQSGNGNGYGWGSGGSSSF